MIARALLLGAALLQGGCALLDRKNPQAELAWEARRARLELLDRFALQARVAAGGVFGMKAQLYWRQRPDDFEARVQGPFGAGAFSIRGNLEQVEVRSAQGSTVTAYPERYLEAQLGWPFPVRHLRYWALGRPAPTTVPELELDAAGRITAMWQDGWELRYDEYQQAGGIDLPRRFEMANDEVRIKVVVDQWSELPV